MADAIPRRDDRSHLTHDHPGITIEMAKRSIGCGVVYTPPGGGPKEDGTITSVTDYVVFVRYAGDTGSKATYPRDLELLAPQPEETT